MYDVYQLSCICNVSVMEYFCRIRSDVEKPFSDGWRVMFEPYNAIPRKTLQ